MRFLRSVLLFEVLLIISACSTPVSVLDIRVSGITDKQSKENPLLSSINIKEHAITLELAEPTKSPISFALLCLKDGKIFENPYVSDNIPLIQLYDFDNKHKEEEGEFSRPYAKINASFYLIDLDTLTIKDAPSKSLRFAFGVSNDVQYGTSNYLSSSYSVSSIDIPKTFADPDFLRFKIIPSGVQTGSAIPLCYFATVSHEYDSINTRINNIDDLLDLSYKRNIIVLFLIKDFKEFLKELPSGPEKK